ncbi:phage pro-head protease [Shigella sonnei]|nr:phage pro-head protease [Shigella sonnei]
MQTKQRLDVPLSLKSVSDSGEFEGYGSVFGVKDSHDDVVMSGAFAASLRAWSDRKALPALLWQHRMDEPIGVYTEMKEDDVGLYVRGRLLIDDDPLAKRNPETSERFRIFLCTLDRLLIWYPVTILCVTH